MPDDKLRRARLSETVNEAGFSPYERVLLDHVSIDAILTAGLLAPVARVRDVASSRAGGVR